MTKKENTNWSIWTHLPICTAYCFGLTCSGHAKRFYTLPFIHSRITLLFPQVGKLREAALRCLKNRSWSVRALGELLTCKELTAGQGGSRHRLQVRDGWRCRLIVLHVSLTKPAFIPHTIRWPHVATLFVKFSYLQLNADTGSYALVYFEAFL